MVFFWSFAFPFFVRGVVKNPSELFVFLIWADIGEDLNILSHNRVSS